MSDERGLLDAILQTPQDDVPRLVYADWLDEHGHCTDAGYCPEAAHRQRAEFIRLQIELARLPADSPRRAELAAREEALLSAHGFRWRRGLPDWAQRYPIDPPPWGFRRGFVASIHASGGALVRDAASLWTVAPVEEVTLEACPPEAVRSLAACPFLDRLRSLSIDHEALDDETIRILVSSPELDNLTSLALYSEILGRAGAEAIASSSRPHLHELTLGSHALTDAAVAALAVPALANLSSLTLLSGQITATGAATLAASPLTGLRTLRLDDCEIRDTGTAALAASPILVSLRILSLAGNHIGDQGAEALATATFASCLRELDLRDNSIGDQGVIAIANSPHLANLEVLSLAGENHQITDVGARALAASPWLGRLEQLTLRHGRLLIEEGIGPEGRAALLARFGPRVRV